MGRVVLKESQAPYVLDVEIEEEALGREPITWNATASQWRLSFLWPSTRPFAPGKRPGFERSSDEKTFWAMACG